MTHAIRIESISQLHVLIGYEKPKHPLITLIDFSKISPTISTRDLKITTDFYVVSLKEGGSCEKKYGWQTVDFQEGSLSFMAPGQELQVAEEKSDVNKSRGLLLCFHPDLLDRSFLAQKMSQYTFYTYATHEALHLSETEKDKITGIMKDIQNEFSHSIDDYSQDLILSYLEVFLNHCKRFYGRQFITRSKVNKEVLIKFDQLVMTYYTSADFEIFGALSVKFCANRLGYSANYLGDLLKKETGMNAQEHIQSYVIERAKTMLLETSEPVNKIANALGFEYPQHFSKLFKSKTGMSPRDYRN